MSPSFLDTGGYRLILGSQSPRRKDILRDMCLDFESTSIDVDESYPDSLIGGDAIAEYLAKKKSNAYPKSLGPMDILITSDTVVVKEGRVMNKPADADEAVEMITALQNSTHEVVSGACLRAPGRTAVFSETTRVVFGALDTNEIRWYVDRFKPFDKAGGYGIQEWIGYVGIERIEGSYYNVMGFPTRSFYRELKKWIQK